MSLVSYATHWEKTRGRKYEEPESNTRTPFQRDRDRIIHSEAFRRLQYKTQVFVNHEGDHYRTRLTHTIEVAQIARSICRALNLDEDLGECIALAHDLGHPPFGHAGEDALNDVMKDHGGYRHNEQTLRLVCELENRYPSFEGLNLTWEAREGIAKHNGPIKNKLELENPHVQEVEPNTYAGLEAQVAAISDDIAYNHHDLEDGLTGGTITLKEVRERLEIFNRFYIETEKKYPDADEYALIRESIRQMINRCVGDVIKETLRRVEEDKPQSAEDVRANHRQLVDFSEEVMADIKATRKFLYHRMYRHYRLNRMSLKAHRVVKSLFETFMEHRKCLPHEIQHHLPEDKFDDIGKAKEICDYISMMTDRTAQKEYEKLFDLSTRT